MTNIVCRAQVHEDCLDGQSTRLQFGEDGPLTDDGTYERDAQGMESIVCDKCYIMLMPFTPSGEALNEELPRAIEILSGALETLDTHPDPSELVRDTEQAMEGATPGSPYYESAKALNRLAQRKVAADL